MLSWIRGRNMLAGICLLDTWQEYALLDTWQEYVLLDT